MPRPLAVEAFIAVARDAEGLVVTIFLLLLLPLAFYCNFHSAVTAPIAMVIIASVMVLVGGGMNAAIISMANNAPIALVAVTAGGVAISNTTFIYFC